MTEDNGNYLSIDLGLNNLMTCYSNVSGETFIVGRMYFSIERKYLKEIERVQSKWYTDQNKKGGVIKRKIERMLDLFFQ